MIVYRCSLEQHVPDTLLGEGASRYGGRWNSKGIRAVYTAESRIMAILELVIRQPIDKVAAECRIIPIEIPESFTVPELPLNWKDDCSVSREIGDNLLQHPNHLGIKIPSALLTNSFNYLINPLSPLLKGKVKVYNPEPILMDERLLAALRKT